MKKKDFVYEIYEPQEDSYLILKHIKPELKGDLLDIGTGSGILALEASKYCRSVTACDINKRAIFEFKKLIRIKKIKNIRVLYSNLFSHIKNKFDIIIFNPPYLPTDPKYPDISLDGGKKGYELIEKFLFFAKKFLKPRGQIILLFSSLSKKRKIDEILNNLRYDFEIIDQLKIDFEILYVYKIIVRSKKTIKK